MYGNNFKKMFKKNWKELIGIAISLFSLVLAFSSWSNQKNFEKQYSGSAKSIITGSILLELRELEIFYDSIYKSNEEPVSYSRLKVVTDSLKENYESLSKLDLSKFPKNEIFTYQSFILDLFNTESVLNNHLETIRSSTEKLESASEQKLPKAYPDQLYISEEARDTLLKLLESDIKGAKWNRDRLKNNEYMTLEEFERTNNSFDKHYEME
ncbi:hypothetical protein JZO86_10820 [Enterococcus ureasiticus]|uniref:hypothetical protein n=1 Tax=Enterococcus ureasiticus TaxID=903984 RepID=UPI001A8F3061|nr:hypothetical protein [Enterococcus ureasiticus]MBO0474191.1 hypothetical protein [Enterococcus ureasiticus]